VEGIAVSDTKGRIIFLNSAWLKIHEYDEKEAENLIGEGIVQFYFTQQLEMLYKNNQYDGVFRGRLKQVRKNGTTFTTLATLSPLRNNKGEIIGTIHTAKKLTDIVRDIQDIKPLNLPTEQKNEEAAKDN
jgi:PAS domain S-box-containing protein